MNNEPVAWMTENGYLITKDENLANIIKEKGEEPIIPLYTHPASLVDWSYQQGYQVGKETHPAKTLTDRIAELEKQVGIWEKESMNARIKMSLYQSEIKELRKAQEK